jgi:hypothetical protein
MSFDLIAFVFLGPNRIKHKRITNTINISYRKYIIKHEEMTISLPVN